MVTRFGMSDKLGTVALEGDGGRALFGRGVEDKTYSEKISSEIDTEVRKIIDEAYKKAEHIITTHRKLLDAIAKRLVEVETIERDEFENILVAHGVTPKKKDELYVEPKVVNF
jgi:cell division protease FtsH